MKYIIGIDGGGTKTSLKAFSLSGEFIKGTVTGGTNYNFDGIDTAVDNLASAVTLLCPDGEELYIGFGDSSIDENSVNSRTEQFAERLRVKLNKKIRIFIRSDAFMALYGHTRGGEGVIMISGTGAMGFACDKNGQLYTVGGWGRLTGDEGSGYYIALSGIKAALRALDGIGGATTLTELLPQYYNRSKMRELIDVFYASPPPEIAPFAEVVSEQAKLGDKVSRSILYRAAEFLAGYTKQLIHKLYDANPDYENKTVGVYGSVLTKDEIVKREYERLLHIDYPELSVVVPSVGPEEAAAMYVRDNCIKEVSQ